MNYAHGPVPVSGAVDLVGNTPLLRFPQFEPPGVELYAKLEFFNPGGSVKDRAARQMVLHALQTGELSDEKILIDSTSGNTGVAYAWLGAALGFRVQLVMPSNVSAARKQITAAYGAEIIYSDPLEGSDGAIRHVRKLVAENPERYFYPDQYSNPENPNAHYLGTALEIWEQTDGRVTHFVAGLGTTGTVMGCGRRFKELNPEIKVLALEPEEPFHGLEGLKHLATSIVPGIYDPKLIDGTIFIPTDEGWDVTEQLFTKAGVSVGHSSGAAMAGALRIANELSSRDETGIVVTLFPDRASRYFEPLLWKPR
ncbi:MAG: PLP-dependent cysteine synthase family protein [Myxococcaceae bacterium]